MVGVCPHVPTIIKIIHATAEDRLLPAATNFTTTSMVIQTLSPFMETIMSEPEEKNSTKAKRPISKRKLAANRRNALKSTGPKTARGKRASRLNGLKHGAYANELITFCADTKDNPKEYKQLLSTLTEQLQPAGSAEKSLVWKFTYHIWRYKKAISTLSQLYQLQRLRGHEPAQINLGDETT